ncbi:MAG: hypothetical protein AB7F86_13835 [Bdellovibrionales bacterium]
MVSRRSVRQLLALLAVLGLALTFQNCAERLQTENAQNDATPDSPDVVLGSASGFDKIVADPYLEGSNLANLPASVRLEINLSSGQMMQLSRPSNNSVTCAVDSNRLTALRDLIASAQICEPGPLPPNTAVCMAYSMADIELSGGGTSLQLRPVMCHSGRFLCSGLDSVLRELLHSLRDSPPPGC